MSIYGTKVYDKKQQENYERSLFLLFFFLNIFLTQNSIPLGFRAGSRFVFCSRLSASNKTIQTVRKKIFLIILLSFNFSISRTLLMG